MNPLPRLVASTVFLAALVGPIAGSMSASAQPMRIEVYEPFYDGGRFSTKDLNLDGKGLLLEVAHGGRIAASLALQPDCRDCNANAQNQVVVGLAGEGAAQACLWSGGVRQSGWTQAKFSLDIPDVPGIYEVRARNTQARSCQEALGQWRQGRPGGPGPDATIGVVVVYGDPEAVSVVLDPRPGNPPGGRPGGGNRPRREMRELQRLIDDNLVTLDQTQQQILALATKPANNARTKQMKDLTIRARALTGELMNLQADLKVVIEDVVDREASKTQRPPPIPVTPPRPRVVKPQIVVIAGTVPTPRPLSQGEQAALLDALEKATFPDSQKNALNDVIQAGAFFTIGQAKDIIARFSFEPHKAEVVGMLCPLIIENGALPQLLTMFTFEMYKQDARKRTGNRCGWMP